jgi:hypothetical protein
MQKVANFAITCDFCTLWEWDLQTNPNKLTTTKMDSDRMRTLLGHGCCEIVKKLIVIIMWAILFINLFILALVHPIA